MKAESSWIIVSKGLAPELDISSIRGKAIDRTDSISILLRVAVSEMPVSNLLTFALRSMVKIERH